MIEPNTTPKITAYPLCWTEGRKRTLFPQSSRFQTSLHDAYANLARELNLLGASQVIVSTNIPLRRDGKPYATFKRVEDCGVAVYFQTYKKQHCFTCDNWNQVAHNIQAIASTIEAMRGIERWGVVSTETILSPIALPEAKRDSCWSILGIEPGSNLSTIRQAYVQLSAEKNPDNGGDYDQWQIILAAYKEAKSYQAPRDTILV